MMPPSIGHKVRSNVGHHMDLVLCFEASQAFQTIQPILRGRFMIRLKVHMGSAYPRVA